MAQTYDAIVIGAGHNGLVCGTYLAKAGLKVLVLERRDVIGGAAVTEEVWPGYHVSVASYVMSLMPPKIIRELELEKFGFEVLPTDHLFIPFPDGSSFVYWDDVGKTCAQIRKFSKKDAEAYPDFVAHLGEVIGIMRRFMWETPPDPASRRWKDLKRTAGLLWRYRKIGGKLYRLADLLTQSVYDYLDHWFESDQLKAVLSYSSGIGTFAGPRTPGTAYVLVHHLMGEHEGAAGWGVMRGGMGAISKAIAVSGARFGMEVRTGAEIERVLMRDGRARGVALKSGEEIAAKTVVSNANAKLLFLKLVGEAHLPAEFVDEIRSYRTFSTAFKINLAVDALPTYTAFKPEETGTAYPSFIHIGPTVEYLERAYDDAKYGWYSKRPFVSAVVPTFHDDTAAPPGKHIINLFGGHAPYELKGGSWDEERDHLFDTVIETIGEYAPDLKDAIIHKQVLTPPDLESLLALPQGHIFHGELSIDQLFFMRPAPHYADYRSPIRGLYQCGSSTHPGGGVMGVPGHNATREILKDLRR